MTHIIYKYATKKDMGDILELENCLYNSSSKDLLPEIKEGLELFLDLKGKILVQYVDGNVNGCIEFIKVGNLNKKILSLPNESPLKKVYSLNLRMKKSDTLVHGWIAKNDKAKWLYREIKKRYRYKKFTGFVSKTNKKAIDFYSGFGKIVDEIPCLYFDKDVHYLFEGNL